MNWLTELIVALSNAPAHISIFFLGIILIVILILIPIVYTLVKKAKSIELLKFGDKEIRLRKNISKNGLIASVKQIDSKTYQMVFTSVDDLYTSFNSDEQNIKQKNYASLKERREDCIEKAIDSIRVDFYKVPLEEHHVIKEDTDKFLKMYLEFEFGKILRDNLNKLIKDDHLNEVTDIEINILLKEIIDECMMKVRLSLYTFPNILEKSIADNIMRNFDINIRDHVKKTITLFVEMSKSEKEALVKLNEEKLKKIEDKLKLILEVKDDDSN